MSVIALLAVSSVDTEINLEVGVIYSLTGAIKKEADSASDDDLALLAANYDNNNNNNI